MTTASGTRADPAASGDTAPAEESIVARWSRRKQAARRTAENQPEPPSTAVVADGHTASAPPAVLTDKDMPPVESLTEESDFSGFLSSGVSEALRRKALYKLFHLPAFNTRCPLDSEYYDCHGYEPLGNIITHEMREALEREAEALKQAARDTLLESEKPAAAAPLPDPQETAPVAVTEPAKPAKPTT
jgi:hypothetical protein